MLEYKIVHKQQFTVVGVSRKFDPETSYQEIPKFWDEMIGKQDFPLMGMFGICLDINETQREFDYWIADNYIPWQEIPEGCETTVIPAHYWAVFPCKLSTLQETNTKMWQQWLPNCRDYRLAGMYNIEMYGPINQENPGESYVELWLPVESV